ncbi:hypothetical protein PtrEW7m1_008842 [Pyrenophora tritici-repentis]|nr:hypothetical protein PtrEW7m1_008842 [Pyrenophora tritici-repentis]
MKFSSILTVLTIALTTSATKEKKKPTYDLPPLTSPPTSEYQIICVGACGRWTVSQAISKDVGEKFAYEKPVCERCLPEIVGTPWYECAEALAASIADLN